MRCNGALLPIMQNTTLFSLLETRFGGDGRQTFALPDLKYRVVIGAGAGPGLTPRRVGDRGGSREVQLELQHLPEHTHALLASAQPAQSAAPSVLARGAQPMYASEASLAQLSPHAVAPAGPRAAQQHAAVHHGVVLHLRERRLSAARAVAGKPGPAEAGPTSAAVACSSSQSCRLRPSAE